MQDTPAAVRVPRGSVKRAPRVTFAERWLRPALLPHLALVAILTGIAWVPYSNSLDGDFVYDSRTIVQRDLRLAQPSAAVPLEGEIWTSHYWYPLATFYDFAYRPLTTLSFALNYWPLAFASLSPHEKTEYRSAVKAGGLGAAPPLPQLNAAGWQKARASFHRINWLYHATNVVLVYLLCLLLLGRFRAAASDIGPDSEAQRGAEPMLPAFAAFLAAALFAVHPIHTEAVTNIVGRADLQATFFVLVGMLAHIQSRSAYRGALAWSIPCALAFLGALFSKESGIVLIGLVLLYDIAVLPRGGGAAALKSFLRPENAIRYGALALAATIYFVVRLQVMNSVDPSFVHGLNNPLVDHGFLVSKLTALTVIGLQLGLLIWPVKLSADYSFDAVPLFDPSAGVAWGNVAPLLVLLVLAGLGWLVIALWRRNRPLAFAIIGTLVCMAPTSNFFIEIGTIMAERVLYLPSVFVCLGLAVGLVNLAAWLRAPVPRGAVFGAGALCAVVFAAAAAWGVWWPAVPLWLSPTLPAVLDFDAGLQTGLEARLLQFVWVFPIVASAIALAVAPASGSWLRRPDMRMAGVAIVCAGLVQLASLRTYVRNEDWQSSSRLWLSAVQITPRSAKVHANLANAQLDRTQFTDRQLDDAILHMERAWAIRPYAIFGIDLAGFYLLKADRILAAARARGASGAEIGSVNSDLMPLYRKAEGVLLVAREDELRWVREIREGLRDDGTPLHETKAHGLAELYHHLGNVLLRCGRLREAIAAFRYRIALDPFTYDGRVALAEASIRMSSQEPALKTQLLGQAAVTLFEDISIDDRNIRAGRMLAHVYDILLPRQRILNVPPQAPEGAPPTGNAGVGEQTVKVFAANPMVKAHICQALLNLTSEFAGVGEDRSARSTREGATRIHRCAAAPFDSVLARPTPPHMEWKQ